MSEKIDWSKAPADATHCYEVVPEFFKKKDGKWMVWFGLAKRWALSEIPSRHENLVYRPTSPQWSGEGLPPVGVFIVNAEDFKGKSEVIIHRHGGVIVEQEDGVAADYVLFRKGECFAVRTPEQIAADEREAAIDQVMDNLSLSPECRYIANRVFDAGYRKP